VTDIPAGAAADETARRDDVLSKACVDEYLHQPEVGPVEAPRR
jgi:hypothetical protein